MVYVPAVPQPAFLCALQLQTAAEDLEERGESRQFKFVVEKTHPYSLWQTSHWSKRPTDSNESNFFAVVAMRNVMPFF